MDVLSCFLIIVVTTVVCLFIFQAYTIYENYHNIIEFNNIYHGLEHAKSPGGLYIDKRIYDPNDSELDVKAKWRCILYNNEYAVASKFGFILLSANKPILFSKLDDCLHYNYTRGTANNIWNPCVDGGDAVACNVLKSNI